MLFVDSADKAARFIWLCDAFNVPLLYLADVPGFMIGSEVERQGIIRHGAKMITAVSEATVPQVSVIVRKAYGAGLYAMAGPGFVPDAMHRAADGARSRSWVPRRPSTRSTPTRSRRSPTPTSATRSSPAGAPSTSRTSTCSRLASDLVVDAVVEPDRAPRASSSCGSRYAAGRDRRFSERRHGVPPV